MVDWKWVRRGWAFVQSIKCFQIEAYKAAYLYSYLALINYIKEIIIGYHGIPIPFLEKIKGKTDNDKKAIWKKKINDLNLDDKWEENTWNFINEGKETNIFKLTDSVRVEFSQKRIWEIPVYIIKKRCFFCNSWRLMGFYYLCQAIISNKWDGWNVNK